MPTNAPSAAFLALLAMLYTLRAAAGEPAPPDLSGKSQQAFCYTSNNDYREPAMYLSDVFAIRVPNNAGPWYSIDMAKVFAAHVSKEYGYVSPVPLDRPSDKLLHTNVGCALFGSAQQAQGSKDLLIKDHAAHKQPVVETGWSMSAQEAEAAAAPAQPAAAPAAAASNPDIYGYCLGYHGQKQYVSAIFSAPSGGSTNAAWERAYTDYLAQQHAFQGSVRCNAFATEAAAQNTFHRQTFTSRNRGPDYFVDTGWKHQ